MTPLKLATDIFNKQNKEGYANLTKKQAAFLSDLCDKKDEGGLKIDPGKVWKEGKMYYIVREDRSAFKFFLRFNGTGALATETFMSNVSEEEVRRFKQLKKSK